MVKRWSKDDQAIACPHLQDWLILITVSDNGEASMPYINTVTNVEGNMVSENSNFTNIHHALVTAPSLQPALNGKWVNRVTSRSLQPVLNGKG
jgi:hypothetical protein